MPSESRFSDAALVKKSDGNPSFNKIGHYTHSKGPFGVLGLKTYDVKTKAHTQPLKGSFLGSDYVQGYPFLAHVEE